MMFIFLARGRETAQSIMCHVFLVFQLLQQGGLLTAKQTASLEFTWWADSPCNWWGNSYTKGVGKWFILSESCFLLLCCWEGMADRQSTIACIGDTRKQQTILDQVRVKIISQDLLISHITLSFWKQLIYFISLREYKVYAKLTFFYP